MADDPLLDLTFNACPDNLQRVRSMVRSKVAAAGCSDELIRKLMLVVDEACSNVIRHAYDGDRRGSVRLLLSRNGDRLVFRLRDYAKPVDASCIKPRDLEECRPGGLGINFIDCVMDSWEFLRPAEGPGNILQMTKKIE